MVLGVCVGGVVISLTILTNWCGGVYYLILQVCIINKIA